MEQLKVPCVVYRGGTSRGLFFHEKDLPKDQSLRERIFLKGIGAEDASHVNGLGGGTSHTSKVVIINKSSRPEMDVDYTFVQLGIGSDVVDFEGTCGNLMAAVGAFAVDEGLVSVFNEDKFTKVNVWNTNIDKMLQIKVPLDKGMAKVIGDYSMAGVKDTGAKISIDVKNPGGGKTGQTLPLNAKSTLTIGEINFDYSFTDIVNPFVYVKAEDLALTGKEPNEEILKRPTIVSTLEKIREQVAVKSGLAPNIEEARNKYVALPKVSFVSEPKDYRTSTSELIKKEDYDILARMTSVKKLHRTFAVSGLLNLAGACLLKGTIPNEISGLSSTEGEQIIRIGHPEGIATIRVKKSPNKQEIEYVGLDRTARRIMAGDLYTPLSSL
ncbi:PrpF domain-containing protein [Pseudogracilibacillus sp. SE30717A]|uniref:PrpF domain-containing protein n=1 Tax=Pseudogracilibacillus sp. SE30717A TaxID=3098293 RepID=UPI00300E258B